MMKWIRILYLRLRGYKKVIGYDFGRGKDRIFRTEGYTKNGKTYITKEETSWDAKWAILTKKIKRKEFKKMYPGKEQK